jgi:hypothetical protein
MTETTTDTPETPTKLTPIEHRPTEVERTALREAIAEAAEAGQLVKGGSCSLAHPHTGEPLTLVITSVNDGYALAQTDEGLMMAIFSASLTASEPAAKSIEKSTEKSTAKLIETPLADPSSAESPDEAEALPV